MFVPAHTVWLLSDSDVRARLDISRSFLQSTNESAIGLEILQREQSLSEANLSVQVSKIADIKRELSNIGASVVLSVHAPYTPIAKFDLASDSFEIRRNTIEAITKCVELAENTGARVVNTHLGGIVSMSSDRSFRDPSAKRAALGRVKDALIELTDRIEARNVQLAIENLPYPLEEVVHGYSPVIGIFPGDFSQILSDVGSNNLGVTVDFCHLWITYKTLTGFLASSRKNHSDEAFGTLHYRGLTSYEADSIESVTEDPFEAFTKPLRGKIIHIHVADSDGTYIPGKSNVTEGKTLGQGDLDLDGFAEALQDIAEHLAATRSTMIVLEPKETDFDKPLNSLRSLIELEGLIKRK